MNTLPHDILDIVKEQLDYPLFNEPWMCDVIKANAFIINAHNEYGLSNGTAVENKFIVSAAAPEHLPELLWRDYEYLKRGLKSTIDVEKTLFLFENFGPTPEAQNIKVKYQNGIFNSIIFRTPLVYFLNSVFSKIFIVTSFYQHAGCLPEHDGILGSDDYSDESLIAGIYNDIEVFFDKSLITQEISPPHFADPYDYCERVEGVRRFILAHEIGHTIHTREISEVIFNTLSSTFALNSSTLRLWAEEIWCDVFALATILEIYENTALEGPALYELENILIGVLTYFTILDVVDIAIEREINLETTHPPSWLRREHFRNCVKASSIYHSNLKLQQTLQRNWRRLNSFQNVLTGGFSPVGIYLEFRNKLTAFGLRAHNNAFRILTNEISSVYNGDLQQLNHDQGYF
jgi:hypothetical protein